MRRAGPLAVDDVDENSRDAVCRWPPRSGLWYARLSPVMAEASNWASSVCAFSATPRMPPEVPAAREVLPSRTRPHMTIRRNADDSSDARLPSAHANRPVLFCRPLRRCLAKSVKHCVSNRKPGEAGSGRVGPDRNHPALQARIAEEGEAAMMRQFQVNSYLFGGNAPYVEELYETLPRQPRLACPTTGAPISTQLQNVPAADGTRQRATSRTRRSSNRSPQRAKANALRSRRSAPSDLAVARKQVHVQSLIAAYRFARRALGRPRSAEAHASARRSPSSSRRSTTSPRPTWTRCSRRPTPSSARSR